MPDHYRYDGTTRPLYTQCRGVVTLEQVVAHLREPITLFKLEPGSDVLLDLTFIADLPPMQKIDAAARAFDDVREFPRFGQCARAAPEGIAQDAVRRLRAVSSPLFGGMRMFPTSAEVTPGLDQKEG